MKRILLALALLALSFSTANAACGSGSPPAGYVCAAPAGAAGVANYRALANGHMPSGIDAAKISGGSVSNTEFDRVDGITAYGQSIIQAANEAALKALINAEAGVDFQAFDSDLQSWAGVTRATGFDTWTATPSSANLRSLLTDEIGTGVLFFLGAPGGDDQVFVSSSASAGAWGTIPDSDGATQKLQYDQATNTFIAGTDDDIPDAADYSNLTGGTGITNSPTGTINFDGTELTAVTLGAGNFTDLTLSGAGAIDITLNGATSNELSINQADAGAAGPQAVLFANSASPAASDIPGAIIFRGKDSAANNQDYARENVTIDDATSTSEDATTRWAVVTAGTFANELDLRGDALFPEANDGLALGTSSLMFSDLFLASGAVVNFNNGNMTITHSAGALTVAGGGVSIGTGNALTAGTIELGAASDTTLSRSSAGVLAVEGVTASLNSTSSTHTAGTIELGAATDTTIARSGAGVITVEGVEVTTNSGTQTLTNKSIVATQITAGALNIGNNAATVGTLELANGTANTLSASAGTLSIEGVALATASSVTNKSESFCVAASDEVTPLTTGTAKVTFRMPYAFTVTAVRASLTTVATGASLLTVDVNEAGTTIISTKLTFDASEKTTTTAATPPVISDSSLADDAEMTVDIDQVGNTTPGKGLKVCIIGHQ